jgi:hypothetical protein
MSTIITIVQASVLPEYYSSPPAFRWLPEMLGTRHSDAVK